MEKKRFVAGNRTKTDFICIEIDRAIQQWVSLANDIQYIGSHPQHPIRKGKFY